MTFQATIQPGWNSFSVIVDTSYDDIFSGELLDADVFTYDSSTSSYKKLYSSMTIVHNKGYFVYSPLENAQTIDLINNDGISEARFNMLDTSVNILDTSVNNLYESGFITNVPLGTDNEIGGFKVGYTQNDMNYPVDLSNEQMFVNVPWTDTTYTIKDGELSKNNFTDTLKSKLDGIDTNANLFELLPGTDISLGGFKVGYTQNDMNYPVDLSNEQMFVNVPWSRTATASRDGLLSQEDKEKLDNFDSKLDDFNDQLDALRDRVRVLETTGTPGSGRP